MIFMTDSDCGAEGVPNPSESTLAKNLHNYMSPIIGNQGNQGGFFGKILDILKNVLTLHSQSRCYGRVVRQWSAKPCTAVRFCLAPLPWMKPPKRDFEAASFLLQSYGLSEAAQVAVAAYLVDDARDDSIQRLVVAVVGRRHEVYPFLAEKFPGSPFFLPV